MYVKLVIKIYWLLIQSISIFNRCPYDIAERFKGNKFIVNFKSPTLTAKETHSPI